MAGVRLFLGFVLPEALAERLVAQTGDCLEGLRTYPARDLHLTLVFLGEVESARAAALESAVQEEVRGLEAPELRLAGVGGFPDLERPRVLWAGVEEQPGTEGRLDRLVERCRQAARSQGWRPRGPADRGALRPHVTLARPKGAPAPAGFTELQPSGSWLAQDLVLLESRPDRPAARYAARASWPLVVGAG